VHGKILTGENLMKKGFYDPFLCALCQRSQEIIQHHFWECAFSKQTWATMYQELTHQVRWPSKFKTLMGKWENYYQGSFQGKDVFKRLWKSSPKFASW
jgi:hypothetical protein